MEGQVKEKFEKWISAADLDRKKAELAKRKALEKQKALHSKIDSAEK